MAQPALKSATPAVEGTGEQTPLERAIDQYLVHLRSSGVAARTP